MTQANWPHHMTTASSRRSTPTHLHALTPTQTNSTKPPAARAKLWSLRYVWTPEKERNTRAYYIGSNNTHELSDYSKQLLTEMSDFTSIRRIHPPRRLRLGRRIRQGYGIPHQSIRHAARLPKLFALKDRIDRWAQKRQKSCLPFSRQTVAMVRPCFV